MIREEIEEAMNILKNYRSKEIKSVDEIYDEAVDTAIKILEKELDEAVEVDPAIKILEQEPSVDAISREAVLEVLKNNRYRFNISQEGRWAGKVLWSENLIKDDACKEIEQLPSVIPKEKIEWIPVSERLPEIHQDILLSLRSLDIEVGFRAEEEPYFYCHGTYIEPKNVLAWMPLPKPYKEVSE